MAASVREDHARSGNLPTEVNVFIGRGAELARIAALLGSARLVTLTGPGGVGKSRLALRAAHEAQGGFPGGAWLVELSPLTDAALLTHAVVEALRHPDQTVRPLRDVLVEQLTGAAVLLVLDTCEHVLQPCARLVSELLARVPELRILTTSRQPLAVPGEQVLALGPLPLEPTGADGADSPAVELFTARASAAVPEFKVTRANRAQIAAICARLDGIPLAIELAAVRMRGVPLNRLLEGLDSRFDLLAARTEPLLARHRTLRTAIGWSHELCTPLERLLWARLSVFAGGWDVEAAEIVCHGGPLATESVLALLSCLTEKSIVVQEADGSGLRFRMLDTLRDFGAQWLDGLGETESVRRRHRDYYRWLARRGEPEWLGSAQRHWAERMRAEHANLRLAVEECLADPDPSCALELTGTLWFFWFACGYAEEGRGYLARALRRGAGTGAERVLALWAQRLITLTPDDLDAAEQVAAAYARLAARRGLPEVAAQLPLGGASIAVRGESARSAVLHGPSGQAPTGGGGAVFFRLTALAVQAYLLAAQGAFERVAAVAGRLRAECDKCGELWMRAWGDYFLALARLGQGDAEAAAAHAREALTAKWRVHDRLGTAAAMDLLSAAEAGRGRSERAARLLGASARLWHAAGLPELGRATSTGFRDHHERRLGDLIGETRCRQLLAEGRELTIDQAIALVRADQPPGTSW
ncbi:ATP-binding protein [Streptomyces formicae]|uniref:Disease resistance domain-containing protein / Tetratricopeptide repeat-containing protein n=1 Tax=Streptomyces formicae TaxID=1616117 RepID=A0A291Q170_9ACTN|nr:AAA family ATPase [Streptomyces formicae]ATL25481.1 Disease resistance domain-containing protein / Tetratricopeptide repeat-containing protein [Streptomyces formicae]